MVLRSPCSSGVTGCQSSTALACSMFGWRWRGSSWGSGRLISLDFEPVIYSYLKKYLDGVGILKEGGTYSIGRLSFNTPLRHKHSVETYGITFQAARHTISYIADSLYFDGLATTYKSDLLIINVVFRNPVPHIDHLSIPDVREIVKSLKPKTAIITHFGVHLYEDNTALIAEKLSQDTGVRVVAARDGMEFDLKELD